MEAVQLILIPCLLNTLAGQGLILPQKPHCRVSIQPTILQLTFKIMHPILMLCPLYLISIPTNPTETILEPSEELTMIPTGGQYLVQLSRAQVKNGVERLYQ